jgi:hypothetical protein
LDESQRAMVAAKLANLSQGRPRKAKGANPQLDRPVVAAYEPTTENLLLCIAWRTRCSKGKGPLNALYHLRRIVLVGHGIEGAWRGNFCPLYTEPVQDGLLAHSRDCCRMLSFYGGLFINQLKFSSLTRDEPFGKNGRARF